VASIIEAEREGTGARGALKKLVDADFDVAGTPYEAFIVCYFAT